MIPAQYYAAIYFFILAVIASTVSVNLFVKTEASNHVNTGRLNFLAGILIFYVVLYIGLRDPYGSWRYLGDTSNYTDKYNQIKHHMNVEEKDYGFTYLMKICSSIMNVQLFYLICAAIYVIPVYVSLKKWFHNYAFFALMLYISSMSFWGFGINGLRNGMAASIFIYALGFDKKKIICILLIVLSASFHKSMLLPGLAFFVAPYFKNTKFLIWVWLFAIAVSFVAGRAIEERVGGFIEGSDFADKRTGSLFGQTVDGEVVDHSFRLDFILYSGLPILFSWFFIFKKGYVEPFYKKLVNTYIITNTVWVLLIYVAFTNRVAYLSWCIMPVILIYPLVKTKIVSNQFKKIGWLILGSTVFTLVIILKG